MLSHRTPGPWGLRGSQIRADGGRGAHVATYQVCRADGLLIAAAPDLLDMLLEACGSLDASESGASAHGTATEIRKRLAGWGLILLGKDEYGNADPRLDPSDTDPGVA